MYYLELIERFWLFNQKRSIGSSAIALYLYLLKTGKDNNSYNFKVSDVVLSRELGLTRQTVKSTKEKLRDFGLIQFQTKNGVSGSYKLILNYPLETGSDEIVQDSKCDVRSSFQESDDFEDLLLNKAEIEIPSGNIDDKIRASSPQLSNENIGIPDLEEFLAYAKTLEAYLPELDLRIRDRYISWKTNGWKNLSGRPITSWKSSLKSTLPFFKNTVQDDHLSLRSIPDIERPKSNFDK